MKKVTFTIPAEFLGTATEAYVLGDFNNWDFEKAVSLSVNKNGELATTIALEAGRYEYRYFLNDGRWVNDANAATFNEFGSVNCVIEVAAEPVAKKEAKAAVAETPVKEAKKEKATKEKAPAAPKAKKETKAKTIVEDKLTIIEGIGPKIATLLQDEGIVTLKDLSKASAKTLKQILENAGPKFKVHEPATWPKQAKLAAAGKLDELKALQEELKGGK